MKSSWNLVSGLQLVRCSAYNLDCPDSCKVSTQWDEIVDEARRWCWGGKIGIAPWLDMWIIHCSFCQTSFSFGEIHKLILSLLQDMHQMLKSTRPKSFYGINMNKSKYSLYAYNNYVHAFHCSPIPLEQTCPRPSPNMYSSEQTWLLDCLCPRQSSKRNPSKFLKNRR